MTRYRILIAVGLVVYLIGAAGLFGILDALLSGHDSHSLAKVAAVIYMVSLPFLNRALRQSKLPETLKDG